jgi:hypothetical protein
LQLSDLDQLVTSNSTLYTPSLAYIRIVKGAGSELPHLQAADQVAYDGSLPALEQVTTSLYGALDLPLLRTLDAPARVETTEQSLPALVHADAELRVDGAAWLPALRGINGGLVLFDADTLYAPTLQSIHWLELRGDSTAPLPDPMPWGLRLQDWDPSQAIQLGGLQAGLSLWDSDDAPLWSIEVSEVQGNVLLQAPNWTSIPLSIGSIGGDLTYCLTSVPRQDRDAWLQQQVVDGEIREECE